MQVASAAPVLVHALMYEALALLLAVYFVHSNSDAYCTELNVLVAYEVVTNLKPSALSSHPPPLYSDPLPGLHEDVLPSPDWYTRGECCVIMGRVVNIHSAL